MEPQHPAAQPRVGAAPPPEPECCAVCLSELGSGAETCRLRGCGHRYHSACIREWLSHRATCPLCRTHATTASVVPDAVPTPLAPARFGKDFSKPMGIPEEGIAAALEVIRQTVRGWYPNTQCASGRVTLARALRPTPPYSGDSAKSTKFICQLLVLTVRV